ncbi:MAG: hypothetical protein JSR44_12630 [Spirochaetes bacterium]|nr:hypothetical protein [Spirochaetota bacterium]
MRKFICLFFVATLTLAADDAVKSEAQPTTEFPKAWSMTKDDIAALPDGNHVASLLEFMFQPAVMTNVDTGGFSRPEDVKIAMFGESTTWQRWYFGGANISNPGRPGEPLLYIPVGVLAEVGAEKYGVSNTEKNGIHMQALAANNATDSIELSPPSQIGGPAIIPRAVADREPASDWGAPTSSRAFQAPSFEGHALKTFRLQNGKNGFLFADGYLMQRSFNNLSTPESTGAFTLMSGFNPNFLPNDALNFAVQGRMRSNLGAEYYFAENQTLKSDQYSSLAQYNFSSEKADGALAVGYAYRNTSLNSSTLSRSATDALYQAPAFIPEKSHTLFFDGEGFKKIPWDKVKLEYGINSRFEMQNRAQNAPGNELVQTLLSVPQSATLYSGPSNETNYLLRWQPFIRAKQEYARAEWGASLNAHADWGFTDAGSKLGFITPAAKLHGKSYLGSSAFFVGGDVLHDTLGFTLQDVSFLNKDSLSGTAYNWTDTNGNGIPDANELSQGSRTGGAYHSAQSGLQAPQKEELNLTTGYTGFAGWLLQLNFNGRLYRKLLAVRYADGTSPTFTPSAASSIVQTYDKTGTGNEGYELYNSDQNAYYAHAEVTLAKLPKQSEWIFRASIGAYYATGYAPQGIGAFNNDIGVYNENNADPNFRENQFGRLDNDRGYMGKVIFGRRFFRALMISNVLRYRDGEAMASFQTVTGLAQGPIIMPTDLRGGGLTGVGRFTYSLAWDLRIRYDSVLWGNKAWAFIDIYNLLNSRTELFENPLVGTQYRNPIEQGMARSMRLGMGMNF